mgnify:CR=1 FL=1|jgi:hypothetical protein
MNQVNDIAIPIVFPDFKIQVDIPEQSIQVPDLLPKVNLLPARLVLRQRSSVDVPMLGHAGILYIDGATGLTRYFEYGRYGNTVPKGQVRKQQIGNVKMDASGRPLAASLGSVLAEISRKSGKGGRISAAYIEVGHTAFTKMDSFAMGRYHRNTDPKRAPYDLFDNSCLHFMKSTAQAGGASMPEVMAPHPSGYIVQVRMMHRDLDFQPAGAVAVEGIALQ